MPSMQLAHKVLNSLHEPQQQEAGLTTAPWQHPTRQMKAGQVNWDVSLLAHPLDQVPPHTFLLLLPMTIICISSGTCTCVPVSS